MNHEQVIGFAGGWQILQNDAMEQIGDGVDQIPAFDLSIRYEAVLQAIDHLVGDVAVNGRGRVLPLEGSPCWRVLVEGDLRDFSLLHEPGLC